VSGELARAPRRARTAGDGGERETPDGRLVTSQHPALELQRLAGNRAVADVLGRTGARSGTAAPAVASPPLQRLVVQRDDDPAAPGPSGAGTTTSGATTGGTSAGSAPAASGPAVPGGSGTVAAPPTTRATDDASAGEAQLASDGKSVTLTVVANVDAAHIGALDILHQPGISIQVTPGDAPQPVVQAAIAALNAHIQRHGQDLIEVSVSPQVQAGPGGVAGSIQAQAELHITASFSITASTAVGVSPHSDSPDPSQLRIGGNRDVDITWQPISIGTLWHLGADDQRRSPGPDLDYAALAADARVISWVSGQLNRADFTPPGQEALDVDTIVTQLYDVMRGARGDAAEWIMHGMPPANQLPPGLRVGLQRAAQLLAQANPSLAGIRSIRVSVMAADETGNGEHVVRWIPVTLEAPSTATPPAAP